MKQRVLVLVLFSRFAWAVTPPLGNGIVVLNTSDSRQTNSPQTVTRLFRQGDIPHFAQALINGTPVLTQCDVKNRWSDGSVKFALISFIVPAFGPSGVRVTFQDQLTGNNTSALTQADMLGAQFNFEAQIMLRGAVSPTVSGRSILASGNWRYWLQGPIVTAVIIEDRANRTFDINTDGLAGNPLHPIFEVWFYPKDQAVDVGFVLENDWASSVPASSARHQTFAMSLSTGQRPSTVNLMQAAFTQFAFTRWRRDYWIGGTPQAAQVRYDFNVPYLRAANAIPNWDYVLNPADLREEVMAYQNLRTKYPLRFSIPGYDNYNGGGGVAAYPQAIDQAGEWAHDDWKGLYPSWDALYLFSGDPALREEMVTSADLAGRFPIWYREADHNAGTGKFFDYPGIGSVDTQGRPVSINGRRQVTLDISHWQFACKDGALDNINTLTPVAYSASVQGGWKPLNTSHIPAFAYMAYLLTGKYDYLEEVQLQAASELGGAAAGCYDLNYPNWRQGYLGFTSAATVRNTAWELRDLEYAAYVSPDGQPEAAYFHDKLLNNLALQEGGHGLPQDITDTPDRGISYNYGKNVWQQSTASNPSPLGVWYLDTGYISATNCKNNLKVGYLKAAEADFMEHYLIAVLGDIRQKGLANTKTLLTVFARRYFHLLLDREAGGPYNVEQYVYPQQTADEKWVKDWPTYLGAYCKLYTDWQLGNGAIYGAQALGATSYLSDIAVDGYTGKQAWQWFKANLRTSVDARWTQEPALSCGVQ